MRICQIDGIVSETRQQLHYKLPDLHALYVLYAHRPCLLSGQGNEQPTHLTLNHSFIALFFISFSRTLQASASYRICPTLF